MNKKFNKNIYLILIATFLVSGFLSSSLIVKAATGVYFDLKEPVYSRDTFIVKLKISTDKQINAAEGVILYDSNRLEIKEISLGNSLFNLWPQKPVFSNEKGSLSFVGGAPNGFEGEGEILRVVFLAKSEGETKIDFQDGFSVFLNDGQGTQINPWLRPLSLNILKRPAEIPSKDEWQVLIESDKNPPEPFEINLGKDPNIFNGQYFISFFATDKESGIDHYEIQEGGGLYVIGESPYLLKDQKLKSVIRVKAVDKAGNERIVELSPAYQPQYSYQTVWFWLVIILVIILIFILVKIIRYRIKGKNV
ncbi:MAG: cohesin domain-containing protein [Minisyncoccia bacterium]